jgi:hypothetical protein
MSIRINERKNVAHTRDRGCVRLAVILLVFAVLTETSNSIPHLLALQVAVFFSAERSGELCIFKQEPYRYPPIPVKRSLRIEP